MCTLIINASAPKRRSSKPLVEITLFGYVRFIKSVLTHGDHAVAPVAARVSRIHKVSFCANVWVLRTTEENSKGSMA